MNKLQKTNCKLSKNRTNYLKSGVCFILTSVLITQNCSVFAENSENKDTASTNSLLDEVLTIGSKEEAQTITGSAHFIGPESLDKFEYSDIQRISREIPGISIQIEDGYGLRPNISIRGVATERSGRITLLEDNILIAPAPYSAPSAYYFPTTGRMQAFEVIKGPAAITQGPYSIGGSLNMVSTSIPKSQQAKALIEIGEDSTSRVHLNYGDQFDSGFAYLIETHQWKSDGFQSIDRSQTNTGLDVTDYTFKLLYAPENSKHSIELKLQQAKQKSNQSYLGLTDNDFEVEAYRRYGLSELDNIETDHEQIILRHQYQFSDTLKLTSTYYNNQHQRDWFKTEGIDLDGSVDAQNFSRTSWADLIAAINTNESIGVGESVFAVDTLQSILDGSLDTVEGSIQLRSNAREYYSRGLQFKLDWSFESGALSHEIEFGLRNHQDEEDRLQRNSTYQQIKGKLILNDFGELGNAGNRIQSADALAIYVHDQISFGKWLFTPGLRYENIDQQRTRFNGGLDREFRDDRSNHTTVLLPGLGLSYQVNESLSLLAGIHKGFTAPSNSTGVQEESAINYEFGGRYASDSMNIELIGFISDYQNILGECTSSSGSNCEIGDAFNGDAATVKGIEFLISNRIFISADMSIPVSFSYTYLDGQFDTGIADTDFFGDVSAGDPIPYIPKNQAQLSIGFEASMWSINANANFVDAVCARASCLQFEMTDEALTIDLAGQYHISDEFKVFAKVENASDERDILGRQPYGARPNKGRTATVGIELNF